MYLCVGTSYHDYEHCMLSDALLPFHQQLFLSTAQDFAFHTMANAFQGPKYLSRFDFEPYNTMEFCQLNVVQQWNACQGHINELSVQILEMEIYEGPEKNTVEYKRLLWQATNLHFWHRWAASEIQIQMCQADMLAHQHVQL